MNKYATKQDQTDKVNDEQQFIDETPHKILELLPAGQINSVGEMPRGLTARVFAVRGRAQTIVEPELAIPRAHLILLARHQQARIKAQTQVAEESRRTQAPEPVLRIPASAPIEARIPAHTPTRHITIVTLF